MSPTLRDLKPGERGRIVRLNRRGALGQRMADMGLIPGSLVEVKRIAPLGDPMEVQVRGYRLSLRKAEAAGVLVERIEA